MPSRLFIFLALLPVLLFPSCEPGGDGPNAGSGDDARERRRQAASPLGNAAYPERIAAQNSFGQPPQPRNMLRGVEDKCPVHHEKMKVREIPIVFVDPESAKQPVTAKFPFGAEKIISTENALLPDEPLSARVYQCASCVAARRAAEEKQTIWHR